MSSLLQFIFFFVASVGASTVNVSYGFSQITACEGDVLRITWEGYHNIQETADAGCGSLPLGSPVVGYHDSGHIQVFSGLYPPPGKTRYFKCDYHCGTSSSRFEVSCPAASTAGAHGDPHLRFAHGGRADFRGSDGHHYVMMSAPGVQFSLRTSNATHDLRNMDTMWKWKRVEGSFFTEAAWVIQGTDGKLYGVWTDTSVTQCKIYSLDGNSQTVVSNFESGWREWARFGFRVIVRQISVSVITRGWEITVVRRPVPNRVSGPANRLDLRMRPNKIINMKKWGVPSKTCFSHGIVGQSYDGDSVPVSGRRDNYNVPETTVKTSAMAEGAIEGYAWEYIIPHMFSIKFIYSRFHRLSSDVCPQRDITKLSRIDTDESEAVVLSEEMDSEGQENSRVVPLSEQTGSD